MLKAIVFDFDGVIVDSEPLHYRAFLRVARGFGLDFSYDEYVQRYIGFDDRDAFRAMLVDARVTGQTPDLALLCREKGDAFEEIVNQGVTSFPGVVEFIAHAADRLPVAIASGATRRDIDLVLAKLDLADRFELIVSADQVSKSKPHPQTYRLAVEGLAQRHAEAGLTAGSCLAIEDTAAGIESARGAGLWTLGVTTTGSAASLAQAHRVVAGLVGLNVPTLEAWFG